MTNVSSGVYKRSWDGGKQEGGVADAAQPHKRPRGERDVHSSSSRKGSGPPSSHGRERGQSVERSKRASGGRGGRDDYRRSEHRDRDRERDRDRDRDRDRGRRDDRERHQKDEKTNGQTVQMEEREEGEISPPPPPPPRRRTRSPARRPRSPPPAPSAPAQSTPVPAPAPELEMELDIPTTPPPIEDVLAARRAKRLAIRAKYEGLASVGATATPTSPRSALPPPSSAGPISSRAASIFDCEKDKGKETPAADGSPRDTQDKEDHQGQERGSLSPTPRTQSFALAKEDDEQAKDEVEGAGHQISAADYDPSLDRREDEKKRVGPAVLPIKVEVIEEEDVMEVEEEEEDEDDVDDMFAVVLEPSEKTKVKKVKKRVRPAAPALITTTLDSAADAEGYYSIILGEQLDGRYQVYSHVGKGMFANVVRARVIAGEDVGKEAAIKIVRCQESMYRAGLKEVQILNKLRQADPEDKKHIVKLERTFEHRGHLCLVFEAMSMNLRDVVKRFGKDVGLNIRAVRAYAYQLFLSLSLLKKVNVMHADIKPDNILVNEQKNVIKLCDLGSASDASENDITPYLVSRFYRAPEIILGVPYDPALDIWSMGCTLYELYTGKILFPGRSNNQMLLLMMELKGRFNSKMIKRAKFGDVYFDEMGGFESVEGPAGGGAPVVKKVHVSKPTRDLRARLMPSGMRAAGDGDEGKMLVHFVDLLDKCLALDPARRITPREALGHPFVRG